MKTERIHSLDSLRAVMMLLGIVLHSSNTYMIFDAGKAWIIKDPNQNSREMFPIEDLTLIYTTL